MIENRLNGTGITYLAANGYGNTGANFMTGSKGANFLSGLDGADTIYGVDGSA